MAKSFSIDTKLKIIGVDIAKGLNLGTLKFNVDTSALKKVVTDAAKTAKRVKAKFDNIKLKKLVIDVNKNSLRSVEAQIRRAIQNAARKVNVQVAAQVTPTGVQPTGAVQGANVAARHKAALAAIDARTAQEAKALKQIVAQENKLAATRQRNHQKALAQIDARTRKEVEALKKRIAQTARATRGQRQPGIPLPPGAQVMGLGTLLGGGAGGIPPGGAPPGAPGRGGGGFDDLGRGLKDVAGSTKQANQEMITLEELAFQVGRKAAAFRGVAIAINTMVDATQAAIRFTIEFNDQLLEINKILQLSDVALQRLGDDLFDLSARTGVAVDQTLQIAEAFARAGLAGRGYGTIAEITERALVGLQGTTLDAAQSQEILIQVIQQVEAGVRGLSKELVTTTKLFDVLGKAEDITASRASDVQRAFKRSAASIFATGASIEEATALISVLQERTQRGGDVIGTAFKTLSARIASSTSEASRALREIGVSTTDANGNLRNLFDILRDTSIAFQSLTEAEQANIAVKAAGLRQVEILRAALGDFNRLQDVNQQLVEASGDAARKQAVEQKKLANVISRIQIALQQLIKSASEGILGQAFVFAVTGAEKLLTTFSKLDKQLGGIVSTMGGFIAVALGMKVLIPMIKGMRQAFLFFIHDQDKATVTSNKLRQSTASVGQAIEGQVNTAMRRTAMLTQDANAAMMNLGRTTSAVAKQAARVALAMQHRQALATGAQFQHPGDPGGAIVTGAVAGAGFAQVSKKVGVFGKSLGAAGKAFKFLGRHMFIFTTLLAAGGSMLQNFADSLRRSDRTTAGGIVDIAGGAIKGGAVGALFGNLVPVIGPIIGAIGGAIIGAFEPLRRTFGLLADETEELRKRYLKLGIVQKENGEITSAVAEKLDKALRNLESFKTFLDDVAKQELQNLLDPGGATARATEAEKIRLRAAKELEAAFDRSASVQEQNTRILEALGKALGARTGGKALPLTAPQLLTPGSPAGEVITEDHLRLIREEALRFAETLGVSAEEINRIFDEEIQKVKQQSIGDAAIDARKQLEKDFKLVQTIINESLPATLGGTRAEDATNRLAQALENIARGEGGRAAREIVEATQARVLRGEFIAGRGGPLQGERGVNLIQRILERAEGVAEQRRVVEGDPGAILRNILNQLAPALSRGAAGRQTERDIQRQIKSRQEVTEAFESLRDELPFEVTGKFLDRPVNKLEVILREFISDFGREVIKLNEAQLRATTPQTQLADALAENAAQQARLARRRATLETEDLRQRLTQTFQEEVSGLGQRVTGTIRQLRAFFAEVEGIQIGERAEQNLRKTGKTLEQFMNTASNIDLARLFEVDEKVAAKIRERFSRTTGEALKEFFQAMVNVGKRITDEKIVDPDRQRDLLAAAREGVDLSGVDEKEIKAVTDRVTEFTKSVIRLQTDALEETIKSNRLAVDALRKRISEEERALALDARRRQVTAMHARAMVEELTGIRRLVAERAIEAKLTEDSIVTQQGRVAMMEKEIMALRSTIKTEENRVAIEDKINILRKKHAEASIKLSEMIANRDIAARRRALEVTTLAIEASKQVGDQERKRISALNDINNLLAVNRTDIEKFNDELASLNSQFRIAQSELAAEAEAVRKSIQDQEEANDRLNKIRKRSIALAFDHARAEAQVVSQRREAVQQAVQELLGNEQAQVDAQRAVIEATESLSQTFQDYLESVDGAILATTRYNLGLRLAEVQATKVTGGFTGMRQELESVREAFRDAEQLARQMGASEKTLVQLRRESINQQLALFNNLLSQQSQLARSFFTSAAQNQADLFRGIQEAKSIAGLLGGSFENFKRKGEGAINTLGAQLLALPQETRQRTVSALETLATVGGRVGGFTAEQLLTAIETAALGVSGEGLEVDPLFEIQERIAQLTQEQAKIATEQLLSTNEQVQQSREQLEAAQAAKDLAEIQLERTREEGEKLRGKLGELNGQLNLTLLQQDQTARQGFQAVTTAVSRSATNMINSLPEAFSLRVAEAFRDVMDQGAAPRRLDALVRETPDTRGRERVEAQRQAGRNLAQSRQQFLQSRLQTVNQITASSTIASDSNNPNDPSVLAARRLDSILEELKDIKSNNESLLEVNEEIRDASGNQLGTANAVLGGGTPEININVEGTTTVTVSGFEAGVSRLATTLAETFGGFVSEAEARRIANEVLSNIRQELLRRNIITPTTL